MLNIHGELLNQLNADEYYLLSILLNYGKKSHPDNDVLIHRTGWGKRKMQKVKKSLIDKSIIKSISRFKKVEGKNYRASNEYIIVSKLVSKFNGAKSELFNSELLQNELVQNELLHSELHRNSTGNKVLKSLIIENTKLLKEGIISDLENRNKALFLENENLKKEKAELESQNQALQTEKRDAEEKEKSCAKKEKEICQVALEVLNSDSRNRIAPNLNDSSKPTQIHEDSKEGLNAGQNKALKKITDKDRPASDSKYYAEVIRVLNYLKAKAGYNYREKQSKWTMDRYGPRKKIVHLLDNDADILDFQKVIDLKCAEWKGDTKMSRYLNPDTLFGSENFEKYLNQYYQAQNAENHAQQASNNNKSKAELRRTGGISPEFDRTVSQICDEYFQNDGSEFLEQWQNQSNSSYESRTS